MDPFLLLTFQVLLFVLLLMFSDTSSCNTSTNLSPLTAAPIASSTKPRCIPCTRSLALSHCLEAVTELFSTHSTHKHVLPSFCLLGYILAWWFNLELYGEEVLQIKVDC